MDWGMWEGERRIGRGDPDKPFGYKYEVPRLLPRRYF